MIRQEISLTECDRQALAILMISVELEDEQKERQTDN